MAHVLFLDIVGYSLEPIDRQTELVRLLQQLVRESAEYRRALDNNELISLPTGDGMALVFMRDPVSPVKCAIEIAASVLRYPDLRLRMGIHTGPVQRQSDIREQVNVVGGGINTAQRVMDCGDAGHILVSSNVAEVLGQLSEWRGTLEDLGPYEVKHGVVLHLYNLRKGSVGNPAAPQKFRAKAAGAKPAETPPGSAHGETHLPNVRRRVAVFAVVFLVACGLAAGLDNWLDRGITSGESSGLNQLALTFSGVYQRIVAAPRDPMPRYTAVIEIDPETDPASISLHNVCDQRKMMAVLLRRIAAALPSVIVIDKYYGPGICTDDVNALLSDAFSEVSAQVPVVVGQRVVEDGAYLLPTLAFAGPQESIVNIDPDTRKLPLKWEVYSSKSDMEQRRLPVWHETLAFKAANAYEKGKLTDRHPRLATLLNPVRHPYISFLETEQFKQFRFLAGYVLCGREVKPGEDTTACSGTPPDLKTLSGKVVLIGELDRDVDEHSTVMGRIPGLYLQANFIEALLDDRYYQGAPALNYALGFVFLLGIEITLAFVGDSWAKATAAIVVLGMIMLALLYVIISDLHLYVNPLPFFTLAILLRLLAPKLTTRRSKTEKRLPVS